MPDDQAAGNRRSLHVEMQLSESQHEHRAQSDIRGSDYVVADFTSQFGTYADCLATAYLFTNSADAK